MIGISLSNFIDTIIRALLLISPSFPLAPKYNQQHPSAGPWQLHLRSEQHNILLSHCWLATMFWEFCMELQKGLVVGIMGPVKNRSWRVSSQLSPSLGHQLLSAFYPHPLTSLSLNLSNHDCSLSAFLYFILTWLSFFSVHFLPASLVLLLHSFSHSCWAFQHLFSPLLSLSQANSF